MGYETVFKERPNLRGDGCCLGFKIGKFEMIKTEYFDFNKDHKYVKSVEYTTTANIGIISQLRHVETGKTVILIGAHLFWNPKSENVKFLQMSEILRYIDSHFKPSDAIIWGGDLNSKPYDNLVQYVLNKDAPTESRMEYKSNTVL